MENVDKLDDTGDIADLDDADQCPVLIADDEDESFSLCSICNSAFINCRRRIIHLRYHDD